MTIDQHIIDLINADIDGEISESEKNELDVILNENPAARTMHAEMTGFLGSIDDIEPEIPPPHLRHVIMNQTQAATRVAARTGFRQSLFASPVIKYAMTFTAGVLLTLSIISSSQISNSAFDDVTSLVGTIASQATTKLQSTVEIENSDVAGKVSLRSAGSMLILDFDLVANGPVEVQANYPNPKVWFNGFGQLESDGTAISAQPGRVTLGMDGKRRYAVYLYNGGKPDVTINLQFLAGGKVVHTASLVYDAGK